MSILPPEAHFIAGKIEDQLTVWNDRNLSLPHPSTAAAGAKIVNLCQEMINVFQTLQDSTLADYREYQAALRDSAVTKEE